ncbi:unnamed protein product [Leptidea sinapis]|uniref:Uncharacterized protein n=1 Tax=Leptidea sinapis TaxID=189913 RepID=A0A5E4QLB9_9NEOP|nr:unnamed protein product [Leptidea sinapis]
MAATMKESQPSRSYVESFYFFWKGFGHIILTSDIITPPNNYPSIGRPGSSGSKRAKVVRGRIYLGSGCKFVDLHYSYSLGISTIAEIIREGMVVVAAERKCNVGKCTWNHLACRRAANASKHFCRGSTSLSSRFTSPPSGDNKGCLTIGGFDAGQTSPYPAYPTLCATHTFNRRPAIFHSLSNFQ